MNLALATSLQISCGVGPKGSKSAIGWSQLTFVLLLEIADLRLIIEMLSVFEKFAAI